MKTREEVEEILKGNLERYIKTFTEAPGGDVLLKPEYYQERLDHFDEILPIYMAGEIRNQLEKLYKYSSWDKLRKDLENSPEKWITIEDLEKKGIFDPTNPNIKPSIAIYGKVESLLSEFMNELGEPIPNFDNNTPKTEGEKKILDAKRGINALGAYHIPEIIPSEVEKNEQLKNTTIERLYGLPISGETQNEEGNRISILDTYKQARLDKAMELLKLIEEKNKLEDQKKNAIALVEPKRKFSFLQRLITKRAQYKKYAEKYSSSKESIKDLENQILTYNEKLSGNKNSFADQQRECGRIQSANSFENLGVTSEQAIIQMLKEKIEFKFSSYEEALQLAPKFFSRNPQFMEKAVQKDCGLIKYDQTFEKNVYIKALRRRNEIIREQRKNSPEDLGYLIQLNSELDANNQAIKELENPKKVEEGKYKIPQNYLLEEIRDTINDKKGADGYDYVLADGKYNERDGKKLEEIYNSENNLIGLHNTNVPKEKIQSILKQGLKASLQNGVGNLRLSHTVALNSKEAEQGKVLNFCGALAYPKKNAGGIGGSKSVLLCIPKKALNPQHPIPIWGSHYKNGDENYVLPQYIVGVIEGTENGGLKITDSPHNEEKYEFLKYDASTGHSEIANEGEYQNE